MKIFGNNLMKSNEEIFREIVIKVRTWALSHPFVEKDLNNWCTICSKKIFEVLQEKNFNPIFYKVHKNNFSNLAHCFIICNNYLLDCTASQFEQEEIIVKKINEVENYWFWDLERAEQFKTIFEIKAEMLCWDEECNPFHLEAENYLIDFKIFIPQINFEHSLF